MKRDKLSITIFLVAGILLLANILTNQYFLRLDLTADRQYTLSKATRDILRDMETPVTITAYFSKNLPPEFAKVRRDFQDMLLEYAARSKGYVNYQFISPESDGEKEEALRAGIQPLVINVREKDQIKQQQAFMGAVVRLGDQQEPIPFIAPDFSAEYALSSNIKKLAAANKPAVAFLQGHGEAPLAQLNAATRALSVLYEVETLTLDDDDDDIPTYLRALAIVAPNDSFPEAHLAKLDAFLARGGKLVVAINRVRGDLNTAQGLPLETGLEAWLAGKGLEIEPGFVIDEQCGAITVQQQQGFFTFASQVKFPYLPMITNFADHPITEGIDQVVLLFASPLRYVAKDPALAFTPLLRSSGRAGVEPAPTFFNVMDREWKLSDFPERHLILGGILEGPMNGANPAALVVFTDGDFALSGAQGGAQYEDNVNLLVNSIDWLSDDTGLIALRTKGVSTRPIREEFLYEDAEGRRNLVKYLNFGLPVALVLLYGLLRQQQRQRLRKQREQESYA
jgi:gliding-associated putative ABC transporter substrate-binding component GldG